MSDANETFGRSAEGFVFAGFAFERALQHALDLLRSGDWRRVGGGFDDPNDFVRSLKIDKFRLLADQRREFVEQVKKLEPTVSNRSLGKALGLDHKTVVAGTTHQPPRREHWKDWANSDDAGEKGPAREVAGAAEASRAAQRIHQRDTRFERREEKLSSMKQAAELSGTYSVIVADPPWEDDFGPNSRQVELHYPTMTEAEIRALPVGRIAAPASILFLWATPHMLLTAGETMKGWGFEYRTHFVWGKEKIGLGQYARNQHEDLLVGRRGEFPPPPESLRVGSLFSAPQGAHSAKPEVILEWIERWYPKAPKIELFRRGPARPGWKAWGNQAE